MRQQKIAFITDKADMGGSTNIFGKIDSSILCPELQQASSSRCRTFWKTTASPLGTDREQTIPLFVVGRLPPGKRKRVR